MFMYIHYVCIYIHIHIQFYLSFIFQGILGAVLNRYTYMKVDVNIHLSRNVQCVV